jgi:4-hydroxy-tetrahydrodipicolinate synthase
VSGIVPCGTTGESPTLSEKEWELVVSTAIEMTRGTDAIVIAGTGSNSTAHAVAMQKKAAALGADAGLSVNPYYNKPNQEGLRRHFSEVAQAASIPVVLYNIPGRTGVALNPSTVARLRRDHPNIVAVKEATGSMDSASAIASECDITILSGDDSMTVPFASIGATGVVSVVSNILPERVSAMCHAFNGGDWPNARELHFQLFGLCRALLSLDTNPIPIKAAMKVLGRDTGVLRLPMVSATSDAVKVIEGLLKAEGMLEGVGV